MSEDYNDSVEKTSMMTSKYDDDDDDDDVLDYRETPLNACSLETFCGHTSKDPNNSNGNGNGNGKTEPSFLPLCLGCYQLNESTGNREGRLDLYAVPIFDCNNKNYSDGTAAQQEVKTNNATDSATDSATATATPFKSFGAASPILTIFGGDGEKTAPGVLDGKWSSMKPTSRQHWHRGEFQNYYATAHANGEIWIHDIRNSTGEIVAANGAEGDDPTFSSSSSSSEQPPTSSSSNSSNKPQQQQSGFEAELAGKSISPSSKEGICLALAWESPLYSNNENENANANDCAANNSIFDTRIISSYSDGHVAIHRVRGQQQQQQQQHLAKDTTTPSANTTTPQLPLEFELEHHWYSHKIFTCPAEVWCANFIDSNTVVTGGDEGSWKVWDLRLPLTNNQLVHHGKDDFGAGVTVLAPNPKNPTLLAIGSYDETIAVFDLRKSLAGNSNNKSSINRRPEALYHSESLGGGIWRCKWHPFENDKLLVAAMHGGCVVGEFEGLQDAASTSFGGTVGFRIQKEFKLHESMVYGIDWLASSSSGMEAAAASCSFYDKALYLWKTGSS